MYPDENVPEILTKPYNPAETEKRIYDKWLASGFFSPEKMIEAGLIDETATPFTIIMPPPNANGRLHAGHALDSTLKDITIRYQRMQGKRALMVPGSDHAGFETQGVYEKELQKQGRSRFGMSNAELYKEIYDFVMDKKQFMEEDWKKLGVSCDWSRNLFTLDPSVVSRTQDTFIKMFNDGMIYRGNRIVHWNPKFKTSLSDIETEFVEKTDKFYYFQYGPFVIGTSRPETKFGDKYVVVNPHDPRYSAFHHGQKIELEWINGPITAMVIKDEASDPELGTGAMTITPWHSQVDFDLAQKYNLDMEQIIDWDGKLLPIAQEFTGMKIAEAREKIVEKLQAKGLVVKIDENYKHAVRICERTGVTIEPQIKPQWFVKMEPLAAMVIQALDDGEFKILTESHERILRHWMANPIDWNISRQIVWGIQIPAWFKKDTDGKEEYMASKESPGPEWTQDADTFDTWFSSGQWPLMTLGYPGGKDMQYYPTQLMETGTELIFKWIPRMVMFGKYLTGMVPFKDVYLHGMVLDKQGIKMSKSKGNVISPVDVAETFGIDALRIALIIGTPAGADTALSLDKIKGYKHFANKLWNITRFVMARTDAAHWTTTPAYTEEDQALRNEFDAIAQDVTKDIENYRFYLAGEKLYHYIWSTFADTILEGSKQLLDGTDANAKQSRQVLLATILRDSLKLLHPFMPFVTEELWSLIPHNDTDQELLMVSKWPVA